MSNRNCPNCGAPFTLDSIKCEYCGTLSLDLTGLDLTENTPVFIRYRVPYDKEKRCLTPHGKDYMYITQKAIPRLDSFEVTDEPDDLCDRFGNIVQRVSHKTAVTNLQFHAIPFGKNNAFYQVNIEE